MGSNRNRILKKIVIGTSLMIVSLFFLVKYSGDPIGQPTDPSRANSASNYFPDTVAIEFARNFSVSYHGNYKVVKARVPPGTSGSQDNVEQWNDSFTDVMVLVQRGTDPPPLVGELAGAVIIPIPTYRVAGNSDDAPTRFTALGIKDKVVGLGHADIYDQYLKARADTGTIQSIGASWQTEPNLEILIHLMPDITFLTVASLSQSEGLRKTRAMGIASAPDFSWSETSYLAQLEWIKYDAVFMNAEKEATSFFNVVKHRCDSLAKLVADIRKKPKAVWAMHKKGFWIVRVNGSYAKLLEEAGAINPFADDHGIVNETQANGLSEGVAISTEIVFKELQSVDYIISFQSSTENWPPQSYMSTVPAYKNKNLFHHFKRYTDYGAHDWYQTATMRPDLVLQDLIAIFHPELLPNHTLFFFDKIKLTKK
jgi:iron complex transport system substrate-binding protein